MLSEIHIRDVALIDKLDLNFGAGFSALTGETGAGKSIIIDAISAVLGERLAADVIRTGAETAVIEAVFDLSDAPQVRERAARADVQIEDDNLLLSRELSRGGKSQCRANGRICPLSTLKELTDGLLDLHGQHEHQSLLRQESHINVMDGWCGRDAVKLRARMGELFSELRDARRRLEQLQTNERDRAHLLDLYRFQLSEIESAGLTPDEEDRLAADHSRLANAEKLHALAEEICESLGGDAGALGSLAQAARNADQMASLDPEVGQTAETLRNALYSAEEAQSLARTYKDEIEFSPQRLETLQERLDLIRALKRKYGDTVEQVLAYADETARKAADLENSEERTQELEALVERTLSEATKTAAELSKLRGDRARGFETAVTRELAELAMERTEFRVSIEPAELTATGADSVEFLISPNPGEPLKPLARIASGGEMSRIMLALKSISAAADRVPTLIFDEIDTGIGGRTANVIGDKLAAVARDCQVMCVTHLPQIASRASSHLNVEKLVADGRTVVRVSRLDDESRVQELARMLGSTEETETAVLHAKEMLRSAAN